MYSEKVINLFANAENVGILGSASAVGVYTNEKTNEVFKLYLKIENDKIIDASLKAYTGVVGVAIMSTFAEMLKDMTLENAGNITGRDILKEVGKIDKKFEYLANDVVESYKLAIEDYQEKLEKSAKKAKQK